jgi:hypothetical protein
VRIHGATGMRLAVVDLAQALLLGVGLGRPLLLEDATEPPGTSVPPVYHAFLESLSFDPIA